MTAAHRQQHDGLRITVLRTNPGTDSFNMELWGKLMQLTEKALVLSLHFYTGFLEDGIGGFWLEESPRAPLKLIEMLLDLVYNVALNCINCQRHKIEKNRISYNS